MRRGNRGDTSVLERKKHSDDSVEAGRRYGMSDPTVTPLQALPANSTRPLRSLRIAMGFNQRDLWGMITPSIGAPPPKREITVTEVGRYPDRGLPNPPLSP